MDVLHKGDGEERFQPPRILVELVEAGHLGQKTGRGFHDYAKKAALTPQSSTRSPTARATSSMSNGFREQRHQRQRPDRAASGW